MANGTVNIRAKILVNTPDSRNMYSRQRGDWRSISLERVYMVSEAEAREAANEWRAANPELNVRAVYTTDV